jgi:hypothetical protein
MDVILGSGLVGLLAKFVHPNFVFVPFKRSRYYSFELPLAENIIRSHEKTDDIMEAISLENKIKIIHKCPISYQGVLFWDHTNDIKDMYLRKVYDDPNEYTDRLLQSTFSAYPMDALTLNDMLQKRYLEEINTAIRKYGQLERINLKEKKLIFRDGIVEFNRIISTIPLDALLKLCGMSLSLKSKSICYYHIISKKVNLEGASSCLVADSMFDFFQVHKVLDGHIFWATDRIENPHQYFGQFLGYNLDILAAERIQDALPYGSIPDLSELNKHDVICVGSNAQWDDFMDLSSCIIRLLRV